MDTRWSGSLSIDVFVTGKLICFEKQISVNAFANFFLCQLIGKLLDIGVKTFKLCKKYSMIGLVIILISRIVLTLSKDAILFLKQVLNIFHF